MMQAPPLYTLEKMSEQATACACCGDTTRSIAGSIADAHGVCAAYRVRWTEGHLTAHGADLDLAIGGWGEGTGPQDRSLVALVHRQPAGAPVGLMVVDAAGRLGNWGGLVATALRRDEVIGTPLAPTVFALTDVIYLQDDRFR